MSIIAQCPGCGKKLKAGDSAAGKRAKCPECGGIVQIPNPAAEPEPEFITDGFDDYDDYEDDYEPPRRRRAAGGSAGDRKRRPCPMCGEMIVATAQRCRFCGETVGGDAKRAPRRDKALGVVRTGITIIYYGLVALLSSCILLGVVALLMRNRGAGALPIVILIVIGIIGGALAMLVGKFFCLGVPSAVGGGATALIWISCATDVIGLILNVVSRVAGFSLGLSLASMVLGLAGTMLFLFFLRSLAQYIRRDDLVKLALTVIIMVGVTIGLNLLLVVMALAGIGAALGGRGGGAGFGAALGLLGLGLMIVALVTLCLYARLLTYLKKAL